MPNYTYKCTDGHERVVYSRYNDFDGERYCEERVYSADPDAIEYCGEQAFVVFEPTPFTVKAPRDTR